MRMRSRVAGFVAVIGLWIPVFVIGMAVHESAHAAAVLLLGSHPALVLRPWPLAVAPITITGIHVQPVPGLDPTRQGLDNVIGPGAAALVFLLVTFKLRAGALRSAVIATVLALAFYALIEPLDVLLDGRVELGVLTTPEFNYGVPILIVLLVAATAKTNRGAQSSRALSAAGVSA